MGKWIYTDERECVLGSNPNSMSGDTGWHSVTSEIPETLVDENGVPLYKRNGSLIEARSTAEIADDTPAPSPVLPSTEECVAEPEAQNADMMDALVELGNLIEGGTA